MHAPTTGKAHIVWDYNGTLVQDEQARLLAVNDSLAAIGRPAIDMATYRDTFCVPVPRFYGRLLGRAITNEEWNLADDVYQDAYRRYQHTHSTLMPGAREGLEAWKALGGTQSLVSLHLHTDLTAELHQHGIDHHFTRVAGRSEPTGGTKSRSMTNHVHGLGIPRHNIVAIGDAADDALAAQAAGIRIVLYTGGACSAAELRATGAPLANTLAEAVLTAAGYLGRTPALPPQTTR